MRLAAQVALGGALSRARFPAPLGRRHPARARASSDEVGLAHHADTLAGDLSHGDKRKLEIAMLLATDPQVILLDEPMAGVGSGDVAGLVDLIRERAPRPGHAPC